MQANYAEQFSRDPYEKKEFRKREYLFSRTIFNSYPWLLAIIGYCALYWFNKEFLIFQFPI